VATEDFTALVDFEGGGGDLETEEEEVPVCLLLKRVSYKKR